MNKGVAVDVGPAGIVEVDVTFTPGGIFCELLQADRIKSRISIVINLRIIYFAPSAPSGLSPEGAMIELFCSGRLAELQQPFRGGRFSDRCQRRHNCDPRMAGLKRK